MKIPLAKAIKMLDPEAKLSPRQREVLELMLLGFTGIETGRALGISHRVIKSHRNGIFKKLKARHHQELFARLITED